MDFITSIWSWIVYFFAIVGFLNTAKAFQKNYLNRDRPKLEIDVNISFLLVGDNVEITRYLKVLNNSGKIAFRVKLYIDNGGDRLIKSYDYIKPADEPIFHESKTLLSGKTHGLNHIMNSIDVIVEYRDSRGKIYFSRRTGADNSSYILATRKKPKGLDDFISQVQKVN